MSAVLKQEPDKSEADETENLWREYERRKSQIPNDLSPTDYLRECRKIAEELGI